MLHGSGRVSLNAGVLPATRGGAPRVCFVYATTDGELLAYTDVDTLELVAPPSLVRPRAVRLAMLHSVRDDRAERPPRGARSNGPLGRGGSCCSWRRRWHALAYWCSCCATSGGSCGAAASLTWSSDRGRRKRVLNPVPVLRRALPSLRNSCRSVAGLLWSSRITA